METVSINMTREVYERIMLFEVLPAIKEKCPQAMLSRRIYIQQDNAPPHSRFTPNNKNLLLANLFLDIDCYPIYQPPNSPDLNVLDLAFFRAIEQLQRKKAARSKDELIVAVEESFAEFPRCKMEAGFLTLQSCMNNIMETDGSNKYKIEHMSKEKLQRLGLLPRSICVTDHRCLFDNNYEDGELDENTDGATDNSIVDVSVVEEDSTVANDNVFANTMANEDIE